MRQTHEGRSGRPTIFGIAQVAFAILAVTVLFDPSLVSANGQPGSGGSQASVYRLGPQDKVRIKVFAWRPSIDEVYEWKALNDVYSVGASGEISLPLIGDVAVGGLSLPEVSAAISGQMKSGLGLVEAPQASVEIVEFRPFYITGIVQKPGEYAFRPGLTIIKAISLAGGMLRFNELDALRLDRDTISTAGERSVNVAELNALIARRARLEAESNGASSVSPPVEFSDAAASPESNELLIGEQQIFDARLISYNMKLEQFARNKDMLQHQLLDLSSHMSRISQQVQISSDELKRFDDMLSRRLTTNTRRAEIGRIVMQAESDRMRLQATETGVRRDLIKAEMELQELRDSRVGQAIVEMRAAQARIDGLSRRVRTADRIVDEASALRLASFDESGDEKSAVTFTIIRNSEEIAATETTVLQPGDTVKVAGANRGTAPARRHEAVKDQKTPPKPSYGSTILTQDYASPLR